MERSANEKPAISSESPLDSVALHRGYEATAPARIDRLRMAADAGQDDAALHALIAIAEAGNADAQRATGDTLLRRQTATAVASGLRWLERAAAQIAQMKSQMGVLVTPVTSTLDSTRADLLYERQLAALREQKIRALEDEIDALRRERAHIEAVVDTALAGR